MNRPRTMLPPCESMIIGRRQMLDKNNMIGYKLSLK